MQSAYRVGLSLSLGHGQTEGLGLRPAGRQGGCGRGPDSAIFTHRAFFRPDLTLLFVVQLKFIFEIALRGAHRIYKLLANAMEGSNLCTAHTDRHVVKRGLKGTALWLAIAVAKNERHVGKSKR